MEEKTTSQLANRYDRIPFVKSDTLALKRDFKHYFQSFEKNEVVAGGNTETPEKEVGVNFKILIK